LNSLSEIVCVCVCVCVCRERESVRVRESVKETVFAKCKNVNIYSLPEVTA